MGADTKGILWGGGAPQGGNLCLLEDSSERGNALGSDLVVTETANKGRNRKGGRASVSMGIDTKVNTIRRRRTRGRRSSSP